MRQDFCWTFSEHILWLGVRVLDFVSRISKPFKQLNHLVWTHNNEVVVIPHRVWLLDVNFLPDNLNDNLLC
ncbi:MAG: hypothetical protein ACRERV_04820 [Methylococcales bacterium]